MYEDLINMPRPVSSKHAPMTLWSRAAQFSPFAALTGLDEEMEETARLTDMDTELTEDQIAELDRLLRQAMEEDRPVTVTFFLPDEKKQGGSFKTLTAQIKKADPLEGLLFRNGVCIPFWSIRSVILPNPL